jgi:hypothetical protein
MADASRLQRPGFGMPVHHLPEWNCEEKDNPRFPHAIADFFATDGVTLREQRMLDFCNQITDKPRWWEKIHDEDILAKWRYEAYAKPRPQSRRELLMELGRSL